MKSIIIIVDYFGGKWPEWFPLYLESCRQNPTITWLFHTDCNCDSFSVENVIFQYMTMEDYINFVNKKLNIRFKPLDYYKLCDLRPTYGVLYEKEIQGYDFFGYGDIDVIYGDIRHFYNDEVLENNIISTHTWCISGHFALIRNVKWLRNAFRRILNWRTILEKSRNMRFDEDKFIKVFRYPKRLPLKWRHLFDILDPWGKKYRTKLYFKEQYTTPLTPGRWKNDTVKHPTVWYWKNGRVTNELDGDAEFIYFHFMNFKHARYMDPAYGKDAFWNNLQDIVHIKKQDIQKGIRIDRYGFHRIDNLT